MLTHDVIQDAHIPVSQFEERLSSSAQSFESVVSFDLSSFYTKM